MKVNLVARILIILLCAAMVITMCLYSFAW